MNITGVKPAPDAFANGFSYFCTDCGKFFSVQVMDDDKDTDRVILCDQTIINYCPSCGGEWLYVSITGLLDHCDTYDIDPVIYYHAFPPDKPIPRSRTGATPKQVEWIVGCVISDKEKKFPVTVESLAAQLGYNKNVVRKIFEELHITETGGDK
jgi:hypothetical protein